MDVLCFLHFGSPPSTPPIYYQCLIVVGIIQKFRYLAILGLHVENEEYFFVFNIQSF